MGKLLRALAVLGGGYALYRLANERQRTGGMITVQGPDDAFLMDAALANLEAVRMGHIAQQHSQDAELRQHTQTAPDDHTRALGRVRDLAAQRHIKLPNVLSDGARRMEERLYGMNGEAFDQAYLAYMLDDHARIIAKFERQLMQTQIEPIRRYIEDTLRMFRAHHEVLQRIANRLRTGTQAAS